MSKVYCKSDFNKLEKEFKMQRLQQQEHENPEEVPRPEATSKNEKPGLWKRFRQLLGA